ncbi:hypothetical protein [Amycolatopsis speibonae]|uniref:NIPSNAP family protein n=1 Tax=Amycolatopsis speibonae TaxID=1450224 RepID=A0ABV7P9U0_9PSEU
MDNAKPWLLEIRLFTVKSGSREEFDRISREGTIPLMRRLGITVVAHGPSSNNENGYFLLRAFPSEQDRVERSRSLYATDEWLAEYDGPVSSMIEDYDTAVFAANPAALSMLAEPVSG